MEAALREIDNRRSPDEFKFRNVRSEKVGARDAV